MRRQGDRAALAGDLRHVPDQLQVRRSVRTGAEPANGFGADANGEDRFDSVPGLICVLSILNRQRPDYLPDDPCVRSWQGWIIGLGGTGLA